jgi:hypothetical protein
MSDYMGDDIDTQEPGDQSGVLGRILAGITGKGKKDSGMKKKKQPQQPPDDQNPNTPGGDPGMSPGGNQGNQGPGWAGNPDIKPMGF